ncbi:hypothetical protein [Streptomyces ehimensis]|uniref:Uncharacterized protein n=1 Tax=Streptomyces ehimensis TaxID=68195 RepID=A0ABV9BVF0_9ACTN
MNIPDDGDFYLQAAGRANADADAARGTADEARGRAEEYDERGDYASADAATTDAAVADSLGDELEMSADQLRSSAARSYSVTAPEGPAPAQTLGAAARPLEAARAQKVQQASGRRRP